MIVSDGMNPKREIGDFLQLCDIQKNLNQNIMGEVFGRFLVLCQ